MKKTLVPAAALALSLMTVSVGWAQAQEPADCGAATAALTSAQSDLNKAKDDDEKAEKAKAADDAFERADRDLRQAVNRLDRANKAVGDNDPPDGSEAELREQRSAEKAVEEATKERDRARKQADKENAAQLQRVADRTDADELKKLVDAAQDDVNRLCGGVTTTPPVPAPENDVDCDEVDASEAQRILDEDRNDPNNLDQDGDGIACEIDEILPESDDDNDVVVNNNVAVPSGGIATGVGPRDS